jgi:hypothetical protein
MKRSLLVLSTLLTVVLGGTGLLAQEGPGDPPTTPVVSPADDQPAAGMTPAQALAYAQVVADTASMVSDARAQELAAQHGLQILNVTWEDTGRFQDSAVGPNISDMTIQVQTRDPNTGHYQLSCMPVIRYPNFQDLSADLPLESFTLLVGNERGDELRPVDLREFLGNLRRYVHDPLSWAGDRTSLLAERDSDVLVSAQACFLPVPEAGSAEFNPVLFNYQSYQGDPAVLTILVTREGTSVTVIDNTRDGFAAGGTWGQRLFFNHDGERAAFTGQRMSDFVEANGPQSLDQGVTLAPTHEGDEANGLNQVLLIQIPLKQKNPQQFGMAPGWGEPECDGGLEAFGDAYSLQRERGGSDVEEAVIGHGAVEGPFTEIDGLEIERDDRFPIRVTVQFYKATSNGVVSEADLAAVAEQIQGVYANAEAVGSLVTDHDTQRVTMHDGPRTEVPGWWADFWTRHEANTGQSRAQTLSMLNELFGPNWTPDSRDELDAALSRLPSLLDDSGK